MTMSAYLNLKILCLSHNASGDLFPSPDENLEVSLREHLSAYETCEQK